jgi:hypothetical protein
MPSAEASHSRAEASSLPPAIGLIARLASLIVATSLIWWLIRLSDVGTASVLLGTSTVVLMVGLLGLAYWRALSRTEEQAAVDEPQPKLPTRPTTMRALRARQAARRQRSETLAALRLAELAREAALSEVWLQHQATLESMRQQTELYFREGQREHELKSHESWTELAQSVQEVRAEVEPPQKRRRAQRRQKDELATTESGQ